MQSVSSWIWTRVAVSISYDDNLKKERKKEKEKEHIIIRKVVSSHMAYMYIETPYTLLRF